MGHGMETRYRSLHPPGTCMTVPPATHTAACTAHAMAFRRTGSLHPAFSLLSKNTTSLPALACHGLGKRQLAGILHLDSLPLPLLSHPLPHASGRQTRRQTLWAWAAAAAKRKKAGKKTKRKNISFNISVSLGWTCACLVWAQEAHSSTFPETDGWAACLCCSSKQALPFLHSMHGCFYGLGLAFLLPTEPVSSG